MFNAHFGFNLIIGFIKMIAFFLLMGCSGNVCNLLILGKSNCLPAVWIFADVCQRVKQQALFDIIHILIFSHSSSRRPWKASSSTLTPMESDVICVALHPPLIQIFFPLAHGNLRFNWNSFFRVNYVYQSFLYFCIQRIRWSIRNLSFSVFLWNVVAIVVVSRLCDAPIILSCFLSVVPSQSGRAHAHLLLLSSSSPFSYEFLFHSSVL